MALGGVPGTPVSPTPSPEKAQHKNFRTESKDKQGASIKVKPTNSEGQGYTPGYTGHVPQDKYRFGNSPYSESEQLQPSPNVPHHWG